MAGWGNVNFWETVVNGGTRGCGAAEDTSRNTAVLLKTTRFFQLIAKFRAAIAIAAKIIDPLIGDST